MQIIRVRFITADGSATREVEAAPGDTLLRAGQNAGAPLEGTCEGQMACSTCHVLILPEHASRLPPPSEEEEDLLDLAPAANRHSRLSCQIVLTPALDGLTVQLPREARDLQGR